MKLTARQVDTAKRKKSLTSYLMAVASTLR